MHDFLELFCCYRIEAQKSSSLKYSRLGYGEQQKVLVAIVPVREKAEYIVYKLEKDSTPANMIVQFDCCAYLVFAGLYLLLNVYYILAVA